MFCKKTTAFLCLAPDHNDEGDVESLELVGLFRFPTKAADCTGTGRFVPVLGLPVPVRDNGVP